MAIPALPRTTILVNEQLPKDLANIVLKYFRSELRCWFSIGYAGEYETCLQIPKNDWYWEFEGACRGGHIELVNLMISKGANNWNDGLQGACRGGHVEIAQLMITHGANNWNYGLYNACRSGHMELVNLMITHGANNFSWGCCEARRAGHKEIAKLMISKGAVECNDC